MYFLPVCSILKEEFRNPGVGKRLLKYIEEINFCGSSKLFLAVGDFNEG
jgi:hypothetical protein